MASVCIICKENKKGAPVIDDIVISTIRSVKQKLGVASNNTLVVCKDCMEQHLEKRRGFEKTLLHYGVLAGVMALVLILLSRSIQGFLLALLLGLFIVSFSIFKYHPDTAQKK